MTSAARLRRLALSQARLIRDLALRRQLLFPPLVSATLDGDDVALARELLSHRETWSDDQPVRDFEHRFSAWNKSRYSFAFISGRVALSACIDAMGLRSGDEVIVPGYTCIAVENSLRFAGITPVYSDIELETFGLDVAKLESRVTSRSRAIVIQHLYGLVCRDYEELLRFAEARGLQVVEDCAHSTGAIYQGVRVGNRGAVAIYSSEHSKVFNSITGGVAVTGDDQIAERLRHFQMTCGPPDDHRIELQLRVVGWDYLSCKHSFRRLLGDWITAFRPRDLLGVMTDEELNGRVPEDYRLRMPGPVARIATNQLEKLDEYNARRRRGARHWDRWCEENEVLKPLVLEGSIPVFLRYPVLVRPERKRDLSWAKRELGVEPGDWFRTQLHPAPASLPGCPAADEAVARCINLPTLMDSVP